METDTTVEYKIGSDFCIPEGDTRSYTISCGINTEGSPTQSRAFPIPDRAWFHNGDLLYRVPANMFPGAREFPEFFMDTPGRMLLAPDAIFPTVFATTSTGGLLFDFGFDNLTLPEAMRPPGVTMDNFRDVALMGLIGEWTCEANNTFGMDTATSVVRLCGM